MTHCVVLTNTTAFWDTLRHILKTTILYLAAFVKLKK